MRELLDATFRKALAGSHPRELTSRGLPDEEPALILAVGKAAFSMVEAAHQRYPDVPWLATPPANAVPTAAFRNSLPLTELPSSIPAPRGGEVLPGSHPLPDTNSLRAAERALKVVSELGEDALLLVLISGGGSALWCAPNGVDLEQKRALTSHLQRAGADITELNAVRRHLSLIKGGGLLRATRARVLTLVLSDVPDGAPWDVASGPSTSDPTTFQDAIDVLSQFPGDPTVPAQRHFRRGMAGEVQETVKPGTAEDARSRVEVVGSSRTLVSQAAAYLERSVGVQAVVLHHDLVGEARKLAERHALLVAAIRNGGDGRQLLPLLADDVPYVAWRLARLDRSQPVALITGGEATVTVKGEGRGGRNQEFALALALALQERAPGANVWALSAGSDGVDGTSDAAGAFVTPDTVARASRAGLDAAEMLERNDSHGFFAAIGDQLMTGQTGHNLNDLRVVLLPPADPGIH